MIEKLYENSPVFIQNLMISVKGYLLRHQRFGADGGASLISEHAARELMTPANAATLQLQMLKAFVEHARSTTAHYGSVVPESLRIENLADIRKLPILEKDTLRNRTSEFKSSVAQGKLIEAHTSGTTGTPITVFFTGEDFKTRMAAWERMWNWYGVTQASRKIRFSGRTFFAGAERSKVFWRYNAAYKQMFMSSYHMTPENLDLYVEKIQSFRPDIIDGYPSSIYLVARHCLKKGITSIRPKLVMTTAETLEDFQREAIIAAFACPVKTQYGSSEGAPLACEDENGELALLPQSGIIEIVKPGTDIAVAEGETGEMLVTCFNTHAYPLIRYRIGDSCALNGYTKKRPGFQRIENLAGRQEDYVISPERGPIGRLDPVFKKSPSSIIECQIVQSSVDTLELHYVPDSATFEPAQLQVVIDEIHLRCGKMNVNLVEHKERLPRSANGKLRAVVGLKF